jgi:hypothetical protein
MSWASYRPFLHVRAMWACLAPIGSGVGLHARPLRQRVGLRCLPQLAASWWWMRPHAAFAAGPISMTLRYSLYDASCPSSRTVSSLLRARLFPAALHPPAPALCIVGGERPSTRRCHPPARPSAPRPTSHSAVRCTSAPTGVMYPRAPMTDCACMGMDPDSGEWRAGRGVRGSVGVRVYLPWKERNT